LDYIIGFNAFLTCPMDQDRTWLNLIHAGSNIWTNYPFNT
jgi:hypothetical protein